MDADSDIARPKVQVIPTANPADLTYAEIGTIVMSSAKLYVAVSAGSFELVTSA